MLHEPVEPQGKDYGSAYKTRLGVWMFLLYGVVYAGFLAINLISPQSMAARTPVFGLNLATVYGFGLIVFALLEALVYNWLCTSRENRLRREDDGDAGSDSGEARP